MKLKNKKTGEIVIFGEGVVDLNQIGCKNVSEMIEAGWEDYEEPKEYWYVSCDGRTLKATTDEDDYNEKHIAGHKEIGNHFGTKEEAEKAVERLRAWKRLKDKGFRFVEGYLDNNDDFVIKAKLGHVGLIDQPDVSLLFGGKE